MNIIEHLTRTVTPIVLGNNVADANRTSLLERVYAIIVSRLADNDIYNGFANTTVTNEDHGFFDRLLPEAGHRSNMARELAGQYNVPEQETQSLISRAAPLVYNELRNLAGTTPLSTFLGSNLATVGSSLPAWSYALVPSGVLSAMNINDTNRVHTQTTPVTKTVTRTEEHLVATPKQEEGGLMKMLLPLIGLLILGALAWALLKSCNKTEPVTTTTVVSSTTSSTTQVTPVAVDTASTTASANTATVMASNVTINGASAASATTMAPVMTDTASATTTTTTTQTISTTEPSVVFENGRLSFYFATGKADVAGNAKEKANDILEAAKQGKKIGISGYTDSTGSAAANEKLAKERAQAVKAFLVANGVPESQLDLRKPDDTVGAAGKDQEGRRVDAYIIDDNAIPATGTTTTTTVVASPAQ